MAFLYHPVGNTMHFNSEEDKEKFLQMMRDQKYHLYEWFMEYQNKRREEEIQEITSLVTYVRDELDILL